MVSIVDTCNFLRDEVVPV